MKPHDPQISVQVDVANPGQFFACCGLLELAHRLWPGAEGCFLEARGSFQICSGARGATLQRLISALCTGEIAGLTDEERKERDSLETEKRALRREHKTLVRAKEDRRKELGSRAREGAVVFGSPFAILLNWWESDDEATPKTWAAQQETHRIATAAQAGLKGHSDLSDLLNWSGVLRPTAEYRKKKADALKKVEPFYFDARRYTHALDTGFSPDAQKMETIAHPAVELLALVGLQRFRPVASETRGVLDYFVWSVPLPAIVAAAVASGAVPHPDARRYHSRLRYRDNQRRYKAFSPANQIGPTPNE